MQARINSPPPATADTLYVVTKGLAVSGSAVRLLSAHDHFGLEFVLTNGTYQTPTRSVTFLLVSWCSLGAEWACTPRLPPVPTTGTSFAPAQPTSPRPQPLPPPPRPPRLALGRRA